MGDPTWGNGWQGGPIEPRAGSLAPDAAERLARELNGPRPPGPVLQDWVLELPWIQQTTLITALRGPDEPAPDLVRHWVLWLRSRVLRAAIPGHPFMSGGFLVDQPDALRLGASLELLPAHYVVHLMEAVKVCAYTVSGPTGERCWQALLDCCTRLRVEPEGREAWATRTAVMPR